MTTTAMLRQSHWRRISIYCKRNCSIIGILNVDETGKIFLIFSCLFEKDNYSTISQIFNKALFTLWPSGIQNSDVLLFLSDAAPYIIRQLIGYKLFTQISCTSLVWPIGVQKKIMGNLKIFVI